VYVTAAQPYVRSIHRNVRSLRMVYFRLSTGNIDAKEVPTS
jgi:hypothetical protein